MEPEREQVVERASPGRRKVPAWTYPLLLLVLGAIVFWVLPLQVPPTPVRVEFSSE